MKQANPLIAMAVCLAFILCAMGTSFSFAQSGEEAAVAAPDAPVTESAQSPESKLTLIGLWKTGGIMMYPMGLLSVAAFALAAFGFINYREDKMMRSELVPVIERAVRDLDFAQASRVCENSPSVMTNILHAGLQRLSPTHMSIQSVEKAMEEAAVEENTIGLKPANYLSVIASVAPMCGLLGTVSGMIKAFEKLGMGQMGEAEKLAADIGEAMVTTAFGLLIGIPAMFFYFWLKSKYTGNMAHIGRIVGNVTHDMTDVFEQIQDGSLDAGSITLPTRGAPTSAAAPVAETED